MITYNQYQQLRVRRRRLAVTCLSWRDLGKETGSLPPVCTCGMSRPSDVITHTWDHLASSRFPHWCLTLFAFLSSSSGDKKKSHLNSISLLNVLPSRTCTHKCLSCITNHHFTIQILAIEYVNYLQCCVLYGLKFVPFLKWSTNYFFPQLFHKTPKNGMK